MCRPRRTAACFLAATARPLSSSASWETPAAWEVWTPSPPQDQPRAGAERGIRPFLPVAILPATPVATICRTTAASFSIRPRTKPDCDLAADFVLLATGSDPQVCTCERVDGGQPLAFETSLSYDSLQGYRLAASLTHTLLPPRPSLFTLKIPDPALTALAGVSERSVIESLEFSVLVLSTHLPHAAL